MSNTHLLTDEELEDFITEANANALVEMQLMVGALKHQVEIYMKTHAHTYDGLDDVNEIVEYVLTKEWTEEEKQEAYDRAMGIV